MQKKPTIIVMQFDSPQVTPELANDSAALLATFGVGDEALFDVLMGKFNPTGKLPFELPASMEAVREQLEDLRFGARMLRSNSSFTLVAVVTLALGIGANTVIFSVVNGVLPNLLPYADPERLVMFWESGAKNRRRI